MVTLRTIVIAVVVAAAGVTALFWYFQSDTAKIRKQFKAIAEAASKDAGEHELTAAAGARKIGRMFAENCRIEIPAYDISRTYAREDIPGRIMGARSRYSEISMRFHDLDIRFPSEQTARVHFTAYVEALRITGERVREGHEITCRLEQIEGDWLIHQIEAVTVLER